MTDKLATDSGRRMVLSTLEDARFFMDDKDQDRLKGLVSLLGENGVPMLTKVVSDIAVYIKGDIDDPSYPEALKRYSRCYSDLSSEELFNMCRHLISVFDIRISPPVVSIGGQYVVPPEIKTLLEARSSRNN